MRLFHPFVSLIALANAAGTDSEHGINAPTTPNHDQMSISHDTSYNTPFRVLHTVIGTSTVWLDDSSTELDGSSTKLSDSQTKSSASSTSSSSSTASSASIATPSSPTPLSITNMTIYNNDKDNDDDGSKTIDTLCTNPQAKSTNLLTNGNFSLPGLAPWTVTGNLTQLPGNLPSWGIDSVPNSASSLAFLYPSSFDHPDSNDVGASAAGDTTNAFYANVRRPRRREVTLSQEFTVADGHGESSGSTNGLLYFGVKVRASRPKPPATMECDYYFSPGGGAKEQVMALASGKVPVPTVRGSWGEWSVLFDGGSGGRGADARQGVRCRIGVVEGDFDGNEDVTVYLDDAVVAGCS
ncbi:hypothetical protein DIS24_g7100 [Lasiodiplodia hormozganensis]|uniref:Uncharacterized protein n=1 Tax=Lasiodiplodia hormozganensis TaxID=869390 RepID=A0AA40CSZ5_9PEZI|nr:hypothetical protein DIS24_g7100 [Lasiodiplodia hormozganensis]